ncbi:family 43 glycosylhydrolase [Cellulomonas sp. P5_E12]
MTSATRVPTRPVIAGFHPDPSVCRVGEAFYLACSSFEYAPGVPVFRSVDLVDWTLVGHALDRPDQLALARVGPSGGIYAPTLRHHDGRFWLVTTNVDDGPGHLVVSAADPAGPWSAPVRIEEAGGIDPDLAWDDLGTCYLTWSDGGILQAEVDLASGRLLTEPRRLWSGTGGRDPEGPHLYRVGDTWYLVLAEGGTGLGHAVSVARGPAPTGPFEPFDENPVLTARGTSRTVQSTGHGDLVERSDGSWALVHLGVRSAGRFPGWHVLGRETFAVQVDWVNGWPRVGEPLEPPETAGWSQRLDGTVPELPADWVGAAVFPDEVLRRAEGRWRLSSPAESAGEHDARTFVGRRQEHRTTTVRARIDATDGVGGLEVRIDPRHALTLEVDGGRVRAVARIGSVTTPLGEWHGEPGDDPGGVVLELRADPGADGAGGPDVLVACVERSGLRTELGRLDGRYLSSEVAGGFTGRMVGAVCSRGHVDVLDLEYAGAT